MAGFVCVGSVFGRQLSSALFLCGNNAKKSRTKLRWKQCQKSSWKGVQAIAGAVLPGTAQEN